MCGLLQKQNAAIRAPLGICEKHKDKVLRDGCSSKTILDLVTKLKTRLSFSDHDTCGRDDVFPRRAVSGCGSDSDDTCTSIYHAIYIACNAVMLLLFKSCMF